MKKLLLLGTVATLLTGCVYVPAARPLEEQRSYIDKTVSAVSVPNALFMETPQSKSIHVGSNVFAQVAGCQLMQRYKVRTAATFTESLNLFKYRAALMGAKRIAIVKHEEVDAKEGRIAILDDDVVYIQAGTSLAGAHFHTTITADLYDCAS
jgi:hypothetical protein